MNDTTGKTVPVEREIWPAVQGEAGGHSYSSNLAETESVKEELDGTTPEA
ncbi:hypothetical protein [Arenibaculum sp.]|nr:hypothetical protein [Arenibaculum sp.]